MRILSEEEGSRIYTINLSKVWLAPRIRRTKRAINMIREFARRHMKSEDVKIEQSLNEMMWKRGIRHPPRRVRVKMMKDEDDVVTVSLYTEDLKEGNVKEKLAAEADVPPTPPTADETAVEGTEKEQETVPSELKKIEAIEGKGGEEETKMEETKMEETKMEETKMEETKMEETKMEETKMGNKNGRNKNGRNKNGRNQKKKEMESEQEKIEMGEEELAEILDKETEGLEIKEEKSEKPKEEKSKED